MLAEQKGEKPTPEKIVAGTGWGFLIPASTEPHKLTPDQTPPVKPGSSDTLPPQPPPPNH